MEETLPTAHRRQFLIARRARDGWATHALPDGYVLSYDPALPLALRGTEITLGIRTEQSAGRYATIRWPYIAPDAAALLAVYFNETGVSSSQSIIGSDPSPSIEKSRLNYFPVPGSRFRDTRCLLRDQTLNIVTGEVHYCPKPLLPLADFSAATDGLASALVVAAQELASRSERVLLGLTAGLDSRTILAALLAANIKVETVTQIFPGMDRTDLDVAKAISAQVGVPHHAIRAQAFDNSKLQIWREHTGESFNDLDMHWFPLGLWRFLRPDDLFLKGGCFELGRRFYEYVPLTFETATGNRLMELLRASHGSDVLDEWLRWRRDHPNGLDLVDSLYMDQRLGGWRASTEQAKDALTGEFVHLANSPAVYNALITPTPEQRRQGTLQFETIRLLEPGLLKMPFNKPKISRRIVRKIRRIVRRVAGA